MALPKFNSSQLISAAVIPALVIIVGVLGIWVVWPKFAGINDARAELALKRSNAAQQEQQLANLQQVVSVFELNQSRVASVDRSIPSAPKVPDLLANIELLAQQSGLNLTNITIAPATTLETAQAGQGVSQLARTESILRATNDLGVLNITIQVTGFYPNVKVFLDNVEHNLRIFSIEELGIRNSSDSNTEQDYDFLIKTYYQRDNSSPTSQP